MDIQQNRGLEQAFPPVPPSPQTQPPSHRNAPIILGIILVVLLGLTTVPLVYRSQISAFFSPATNTPVAQATAYTSYKLIINDQQLSAISANGEKNIVVPSIQKILPNLSSGYELGKLTPSPVGGDFVFFLSYKPETDGGTEGFYSFNATTGQLARITILDTHHERWGDLPISPDGLVAISGIDDESTGKKLYLIDLAKNSATVIETLGEGETLISGDKSFGGGLDTSLEWINNSTVRFGIYSTDGKHTFLRKETRTVSRSAIYNSQTPNTSYELTSLTKNSRDQELVAFDQSGKANTLVASVKNALPELGKYGYLSGLSFAKENGKLYLAGHICNDICHEVPVKLYSFDLVAKAFSTLSNATQYWSSDITIWAKNSPERGNVSRDGLHFISIYDSKNPDDRTTLYLVNLENDSVRILKKLSYSAQSHSNESFVRANNVAEIEWLDGDSFSITIFQHTIADAYFNQSQVKSSAGWSAYQELRKETFTVLPTTTSVSNNQQQPPTTQQPIPNCGGQTYPLPNGSCPVVVQVPPSSSSMSTYTNTKYGFSVQYPSSVQPVTFPSSFAYEYNSMFADQINLFGIKYEGGTVEVAVGTSDADIAKCFNGKNSSESTTIGGVSFSSGGGYDFGAGQKVHFVIYTTLHNNVCYVIYETAFGGRSDALIFSAGLDSIVQSFKFLK